MPTDLFRFRRVYYFISTFLNGCVAAMDARLVKTNILQQLLAPAAMWIKISAHWDVINDSTSGKTDSNASLTSRHQLIYVNLCFHFHLI